MRTRIKTSFQFGLQENMRVIVGPKVKKNSYPNLNIALRLNGTIIAHLYRIQEIRSSHVDPGKYESKVKSSSLALNSGQVAVE